METPALNPDASQDFIQKFQGQAIKKQLEPALDPVRDLTRFERAAKDQFAQKEKPDLSVAYFTGPNLDKSTEEIVTEQYGPKVMALDAATKEMDAATQQASHDDIIRHIDGAGVASDINAGTPQVQAGMVGSSDWQRTSDQLEQEYARDIPEPTPHQIGRPSTAQGVLALILGLSNPGAIPQIVNAMFQTEDERRQYLDKLDAAKYMADTKGQDATIRALEQHLRTIEMRDSTQARLQTQTNIANAGNASRESIAANNEAGRNKRAALRADSQMALLVKRIDHEDNKKAAEIQSEFDGRRKLLAFQHPDWQDEQLDEEAARYANSKVENTLASTENLQARTARTLALTPVEVEMGKQKIKLTAAQREWIQTKIDYYPEYLDAIAQRVAQGWARVKLAQEANEIRRDAQSGKDYVNSLKFQYKQMGSDLKRLEETTAPTDIVGQQVITKMRQDMQKLSDEIIGGPESTETSEEPGGFDDEGYQPVQFDMPKVGKLTEKPGPKFKGGSIFNRFRKTRASVDLGPFADSV